MANGIINMAILFWAILAIGGVYIVFERCWAKFEKWASKHWPWFKRLLEEWDLKE